MYASHISHNMITTPQLTYISISTLYERKMLMISCLRLCLTALLPQQHMDQVIDIYEIW
jgi:hypothetical protein